MSDELVPLVVTALNRFPEPPPGDPARPAYLALLIAQAMLWFESWFSFGKTQAVVRRAWKMNEEEALFPAHDEWMLILTMLYAWNVNREEGIQRLEATLPTLQAAGNRWWQAWVSRGLGQLWNSLRARDKAQQHYAAALSLTHALGDDFEKGLTLSEMAQIAREAHDLDESVRLLQEAMALYQKVDNQVGVGFTLAYGMSEIYIQQGKFDHAFAALADGRRIFQETGSSRLIANTYHWESLFALRHSTPEHARQTRNQQLQMARAFGREDEIGWGLWELGEIQRVMGDLAAARPGSRWTCHRSRAASRATSTPWPSPCATWWTTRLSTPAPPPGWRFGWARAQSKIYDDGPGLDDDAITRLKRPFERGAQPGADGSGLGLAMVETIARQGGARFELEPASPDGRGLCARLRFD